MEDKRDERSARARSPGSYVAIALLALAGYQVYSGVAMKKVGVPGVFEIAFADKTAAASNGPPTASRDFLFGRWQVEQAFGQVSGGTVLDWRPDGTVAGSQTAFVGDVGHKVPVSGQWDFENLPNNMFRVKALFSDQRRWQGTFRIFDSDHIQNIDENYVAARIK